MTEHTPQYTARQAKFAIDGNRIKQIRESKDFTQLYIATAVGVTVDTISRWENNRSPYIKRENADKLADILEVPVEQLGKEPMEEGPSPAQPQEQAEVQQSWWLTLQEQLLGNPQKPLLGINKRQWGLLGLVLLIALIIFLLLSALITPSKPPFPSSGNSTAPQPPKAKAGLGEPAEAGTKNTMWAYRYLPSHTPPGYPFPVVLKIRSSAKAERSFILKEHPSPACTVSKSSPVFTAPDSATPTIKWLSSTGWDEEMYFAYLAHSDKGLQQGEILQFSGQLILNGDQEIPIRMDTEMEIVYYHWADNNKDYLIDDEEILAIYNMFDILQDIGVDTEEIRRFWAHKGYRWNNQEARFEAVQ